MRDRRGKVEFRELRITLSEEINELAKREAHRSGDSKKRWIERLIENHLREQYESDVDLRGFVPPGLRRR